jgi:hypothetical protein
MKETSRRRITVMSSLKEISTDQLGNIVVDGGGGGEEASKNRPPLSLSTAGFWIDS